MSEYFIPAGAGEAEYDEKRSRFLGHIAFAPSEEEAKAFVAEMKKKYYDARHNCWCYIIKDGPERYSDDSEPQGTAGIPMLEVLRRAGVTNAVCVVTRYFGGVLLGAGGLLRAYTRAAADALEAGGISAVRNWTELEIPCSYALLERIKNELAAFDGMLTDVDYGAEVTVHVLVPEEKTPAFTARITDVSAGGAVCAVIGSRERAVRVK